MKKGRSFIGIILLLSFIFMLVSCTKPAPVPQKENPQNPVTPTAKPPVIADLKMEVQEKSTIEINLSKLVTTANGKTMTYTKVSGVGAINGEMFSYTPDINEQGEQKVSIKFNNGAADAIKEFKIKVINLFQINLNLIVTEWSTGPVVDDAAVKIFDKDNKIVAEGKTDEYGKISLFLKEAKDAEKLFMPVTILVKKAGVTAPSVVKTNLELFSTEKPVNTEICLNARTADLDKNSESYPEIDYEFVDASGNPIDFSNVTSESIVIKAKAKNDVYLLDIGVGFLPGSLTGQSVRFRPFNLVSGNETKPLSLIGYDKKSVDVHLVAHDYNGGRTDYIVKLNVNYGEKTDVKTVVAPSKVYAQGWTSDDIYAYYNIKEKRYTNKIFENLGSESVNKNENLIVKINWTSPEATENISAFRIYRTEDGKAFKLVSQTASSKTSAFDHGYGIEVGKEYSYYVTTVYKNGSESDPSNKIKIIPMDNFKMKLLTPTNNATNISRKPEFSWQPVDRKDNTKMPKIGMDIIPENKINYCYNILINDVAHGYNIYYPLDASGKDFMFMSAGPKVMTYKFLDPKFETKSILWKILIVSKDKTMDFNQPGFELNKSYEWGLLTAYAEYNGEDNNKDGIPDFVWRSVTASPAMENDPVLWNEFAENMADEYARFTTGTGF